MMEQRNAKKIILDTEGKLNIYSYPLRQRILRTMRVEGIPLTSKKVADILGISPSSARHHLIRLQEIGLVEHDHYEMVNGIRADYLRVVDATVSIGIQMDDALYGRREQTTRQLLADIVQRFFSSVPRLRRQKNAGSASFNGDLITGIVHLSEEDANQFNTLVRTFLEEHELKDGEGLHVWEFAFLMYEAER